MRTTSRAQQGRTAERAGWTGAAALVVLLILSAAALTGARVADVVSSADSWIPGVIFVSIAGGYLVGQVYYTKATWRRAKNMDRAWMAGLTAFAALAILSSAALTGARVAGVVSGPSLGSWSLGVIFVSIVGSYLVGQSYYTRAAWSRSKEDERAWMAGLTAFAALAILLTAAQAASRAAGVVSDPSQGAWAMGVIFGSIVGACLVGVGVRAAQ